MKKIKIAPSILSADFARAGEEVANITRDGADVLHIDVMDGSFVKNISFGPKFVKEIRPYSKGIFDCHLMIVNPWNYIRQFADAGADIITVHYEACKDRLKETLELIKSTGKKCGFVINPDTPVEPVKDLIELCDMVLVMSVFPGKGGQAFIPEVLPKVEQIRKIIDDSGKNIDLEIDGGVNANNAALIKSCGANVLVAGNTVFSAEDRCAMMKLLREV